MLTINNYFAVPHLHIVANPAGYTPDKVELP